MRSLPSDAAKLELVDFLRTAFKREALVAFAQTFFFLVYKETRWTLDTDAHLEFVEACLRRGLVDESFFINLYLCRPGQGRAILALARHFSIEPECLKSVHTLVPSIRPRRQIALMAAGAFAGVIAGLGVRSSLNFTSPEPASIAAIEPTKELQAFIQAELDQCHDRYGEQSAHCTELAEALRSANVHSCPSPPAIKHVRRKSDADPSPDRVKNALNQWLAWKKYEERALLAELQACQRNAARIAGLQSPSCVCPAPSKPKPTNEESRSSFRDEENAASEKLDPEEGVGTNVEIPLNLKKR